MRVVYFRESSLGDHNCEYYARCTIATTPTGKPCANGGKAIDWVIEPNIRSAKWRLREVLKLHVCPPWCPLVPTDTKEMRKYHKIGDAKLRAEQHKYISKMNAINQQFPV